MRQGRAVYRAGDWVYFVTDRQRLIFDRLVRLKARDDSWRKRRRRGLYRQARSMNRRLANALQLYK